MTGNEICVAAFVNPVLRTLRESEQIPFLSKAASQLGAGMPFWYAASLVLTIATEITGKRHTGSWPVGPTVALALQLVILAMTLTMMVPINNLLGKLQPGDSGWSPKALRWDNLHQFRVLLLLGAVAALAVL